MRSTEPLLVIVAHTPTASVDRGFLPAALRLGLRTVILTDRLALQAASLAAIAPIDSTIRMFECDVFAPTAIIDTILQLGERPAAIFSNSDHLQVATALAASWFDLPAKDWRGAHRVKNKAVMRTAIAAAGLDHVWAETVHCVGDLDRLAPPYPCVVKPRQGVASEHVALVEESRALRTFCEYVWRDRPGAPMLVEEFLEGTLFSLETLGDGRDLLVLGGYRCGLTPPPSFVIDDMRWTPEPPEPVRASLVGQLRSLGVGFGACHTEYVLGADGRARLIEVNYRSIGDGADFLMADALGFDYFSAVLHLHLGQPLPAMPVQGQHAAIRYLFDEPAAHLPPTREMPGCRVRLERLAQNGRESPVLSNRDYRGRLSFLAPERSAIEAAIATFARQNQKEDFR
ncbi:Biotin carboxylase [Sphingomonas sp. YR710]|uniref:ATP-grasp domain-containing protein n=1 Tax=Sphingomonas sp. YR710 TaxID=1882773 RepID=UPI00088FAC25|nr:ATP-grasp domain-containing protein [Sphingomonas sp. YR710]SDC82359.1 Biotin carboxylase [Sphingomonas sp. YR710]